MRARRQLKNQKGFTLAETMLTVLIMLLVAAIMANGIPVARNAYEKVVLSANAQTLMSTTVSMLQEELGTAWDVEQSQSEVIGGNVVSPVTYFSADTGAKTRLYVDADGVIRKQEYMTVDGLNVGDGGSGNDMPLVSSNILAEGMTITCTEIKYDEGTATVSGLSVKSKGGVELAKLAELKIHVFSYHKAES